MTKMKNDSVVLRSFKLQSNMTVDLEKEPRKDTSQEQPAKKEDIFDLVGGDGRWQRWIFLVVLFFAIPSATFNLSMSFLAPNLDHWCARPEGSNWTVAEWRRHALPADDGHCSRYKFINVTFPIIGNNSISKSEETISCDSWEYDNSFYLSTLVNKFDLVCGKEWLVSLSKSVYVAGVFVSNIFFGHLADTLGRRPAITLCCSIAVFSAVTCAFSTSFTMFIVTRFFVALGIAGVYIVGFVLLMELVGPEQRSVYGVAMNFGWCIGFVSLPGIAYVLKDWFWIQITLTAPCASLLAVWWLLPESPRWLMYQGRVEKALKTLSKAAKTNGKKISDVETRLNKMMAKATEIHESGGANGNFLDLLRTPGLWQMTLNIYLLWFVNSFVYYGLSYNTNELAGDPFVNFAICGAVEFPAYLITIVAIKRMGRKYPLAGTMIVGGVACLLMYPLPEDPWWLRVAVSMTGKFCITCSYTTAYVITAETFPTVLRNVGMGSASVVGRTGSILSPFARELGNATHPVVPQAVFGVLAFVAGFLVLFLPETSNVSVPETLAEAAARNRSRKPDHQENDNVTEKLSNGSTHNFERERVFYNVAPSNNPQPNPASGERQPKPKHDETTEKLSEAALPGVENRNQTLPPLPTVQDVVVDVVRSQ